jgi:hypothetical protein
MGQLKILIIEIEKVLFNYKYFYNTLSSLMLRIL